MPTAPSPRCARCVTADEGVADTAARVTLTLSDGRTVLGDHDLADPQPLEALRTKLRAKAAALLGADRAEALWETIETLETRRAADLATLLARP